MYLTASSSCLCSSPPRAPRGCRVGHEPQQGLGSGTSRVRTPSSHEARNRKSTSSPTLDLRRTSEEEYLAPVHSGSSTSACAEFRLQQKGQSVGERAAILPHQAGQYFGVPLGSHGRHCVDFCDSHQQGAALTNVENSQRTCLVVVGGRTVEVAADRSRSAQEVDHTQPAAEAARTLAAVVDHTQPAAEAARTLAAAVDHTQLQVAAGIQTSAGDFLFVQNQTVDWAC
jgi:hypothetical protein